MPRDKEGHVAHLQVGLTAPTSIYVDPEHLDLTFQDTADPSVDAGHVLTVDAGLQVILHPVEQIKPDLARVEGHALEPIEADTKQAVHEFI
jgi:hypothetical protein